MPQVATKNNDRILLQNERIKLTERDSLHVLNLLQNPPAPNKKLIAAARALPKPR